MTIQDAFVKELFDAVRFIRNEYFFRRDPTMSEISRDDFITIESKSYDQLKRLLTDIAMRSTKSRNPLERELKRDRFITAYCNLKNIMEKQKFESQLSSKQARSAAMACLFDCDSQGNPSDFSCYTLYPLKGKNSCSSLFDEESTQPCSNKKAGVGIAGRPGLLPRAGGLSSSFVQLRNLKLFFGNNTPGKKKI